MNRARALPARSFPGFADSWAAALVAIGCCAAAAGCRPSARDRDPSATAPAADSGAAPVDRLADGELVEGDALAFDLALPRGLRKQGSFVGVVLAEGPLALHPLVEYFRPRLAGGTLREGRDSATFEHARVARKPGPELTIHLAAVGQGTRVEIRDETPAPRANLPDDAARWRHVGLTPDGRLLDPTHLN